MEVCFSDQSILRIVTIYIKYSDFPRIHLDFFELLYRYLYPRSHKKHFNNLKNF